MKQTRRTQRVGELIRNEIAIIVQREFHEPELRLVTLRDVEVSTDLRIARVYISIMGSNEDQEKAMLALERNKGRIRHLLGQRASLRTLPELSFRVDRTAEQAEEIERLIAKHRPPVREDESIAENGEQEGTTDDRNE